MADVINPIPQAALGVVTSVIRPLILSLHNPAHPSHGRRSPPSSATSWSSQKHPNLARVNTSARSLTTYVIPTDWQGITTKYLRSAILKQVARGSGLAKATDLFDLCKHLMDVPLDTTTSLAHGR